MPETHNYGGQAVIEGVMIRGRTHVTVAVRRPNGEIRARCEPLSSAYTGRLRRIPFVRGILVLAESMTLGLKALMFSANAALEDEDGEEEEGADATIFVQGKVEAIGTNGPGGSVDVIARQGAITINGKEDRIVATGDTADGTITLRAATTIIKEKGAQVLFWEQRELLKALQGTFDSGSSQRESEVLEPVLNAKVLILDDLGAGRTTAWARDVMHDIIAHRYNEQKVMLITSNLQMGDEPAPRGSHRRADRLDAPLTLRDRLGDALMSRLHEMCQLVRVEGKGGADYRQLVNHPEIQNLRR